MTLAFMSPTGGIAILIISVVAVGMVVYAIMQGMKGKMADTSEQDLVRRVKLTMTPAKAAELMVDIDKAIKAMDSKGRTDTSTEKAACYAACYVDDVNGNGPTLVEIVVRKV